MDPHSILGTSGMRVCQMLGQSELAKAFYLAGGTGLALQLGHRKSLDLDFFQKELRETIPAAALSRKIELVFAAADAKPELREAGQTIWSISGTKVAFIAYPFPLLHPLIDAGAISPALAGIALASPREIAAMKAYALGRRATARDYVDLYFILQSEAVTLDDIIEDASRKYVIEGEGLFSTRLFLEQLSYTRDLDDSDATLRLVIPQGLTLGQVEDYLRDRVKEYVEYQTGKALR